MNVSDLLIIEWPVCRWDLFLKNKIDSIEIVNDHIVDRWSNYYSINYCMNTSDEYDFIQDSSKRAVLYLFLLKYANHLNFVYPCYFIGRRSSDNVLFCVNEQQQDVHMNEFNVLKFFEMLHYLSISCNFIYGAEKIHLQNNKLTNFTFASFFLNYEFVGNSKEETTDFFIELVGYNFYYDTLKKLRKHLGVLPISYEDEILILKFLKNHQKNNLQRIQSKYNSFIIYEEDVELFDRLVEFTSSIQN